MFVCCWIYNYFVRLARDGFISRNDMCYALVELKETNTWLRDYHSKMLQMVATTIVNSEKTLFALRKKGYKTGKLHFKNHLNFKSFTYNQSGFKLEKHGQTNLLWLSKIGYTEIRLHRNVGEIKQITIMKRAGNWYAVICCNSSYVIPKIIDFATSVGIDVGIKNFAYDSDGNQTSNPKNLQKMLKPLIRIQRKVSRRKKGSNNRLKSILKMQKVHEKIAHRRKDFQHKLSTQYAKNNDVVFVEKLQIINMVKNHRLAQSIMNASWGTFVQKLEYKCKMLVEVPARNTTVDCSRCGNKVPKSLAIRIHRCNKCNLVIDRDYNASINILQKGLNIFNHNTLPQELRELTPVEIPKGSRKQEAPNIFRYIDSSPGLNI